MTLVVEVDVFGDLNHEAMLDRRSPATFFEGKGCLSGRLSLPNAPGAPLDWTPIYSP